MHHDAFLSYATVSGGRIGAALESGLQSLGRAWDAPAALDVFRDVSDQSATPDLTADLLAHLDASDWFILLASPQSAGSQWVRREIVHWLSFRGTSRLLIVVLDGELVWDPAAGSYDAAASTALGPELAAALKAEPKWVDLRWMQDDDGAAGSDRFFDAVADLSAIIQGVGKDRLVGLHWREYARGLSRRLAQQATLAVESDTELALLLAAAAHELDEAPDNCEALARVLEATSVISQPLGTQGDVVLAASGSEDGMFLLARADGGVEQWSAETAARVRQALPRKGQAPTAVADAGGGVLAAGYADGAVALIAGNSCRLEHLLDEQVTAVAASADGAFVAGASAATVKLWDVAEDRHALVRHQGISIGALRFDGLRLRLYDWDVVKAVSVPSGELGEEIRLPMLLRPGPRAFDSTGRFWGQAQLDAGGLAVDRIEADGPVNLAYFKGPPGMPSAVALSPGGGCAAMATGERLLLWRTDRPAEPPAEQPVAMTDLRDVVLGEGGRWSVLRGVGRCELRIPAASTLGRAVPVAAIEVPSVIQAAVSAAFSPSGGVVAWITKPGPGYPEGRPAISTWILDGFRPGPTLSDVSVLSVRFLDERRLMLRDLGGEGSQEWDISTGTLAPVAAPPASRWTLEQDVQHRTVRVLQDGVLVDEVALETPTAVVPRLDPSGRYLSLSTAAGRLVLRDVSAGKDLWSLPTAPLQDHAVSPDGTRLAAVTSRGRVVLLDVASGQVAGRIDVAPSIVQRLAYAPDGKRLAVAGVGGSLTLIDTDTTSWRRRARFRAGRNLTSEEVHAFGLHDVRLPADVPPSQSRTVAIQTMTASQS